MRYSSSLACIVAIASSARAQLATQLFNFSRYVDIENSVFRPNGHLLLTTFDAGRLYDIDPFSPHPEAELVAALPGATALTGIAALGADRFAVAGGIRGNYSYTNETIYTVDMGGSPAAIEVVAKLPTAVMLNGMVSLPAAPHVVLAADSRRGCVFRIDTDSGAVDVAFADEATMSAPEDAPVPIGINGLKIANESAYFSNTARGLLARMPISENGDPVGEAEVVVRSSASWDDLAIDESGVVYLAQADHALARVLPDRSLTVPLDDSTVLGPTSINLLPGETTAIITTRGATIDGVQYSGQVCKISPLSSSMDLSDLSFSGR